ncbi:PspC domain-containing protein [Candidatus Micrarchaeota archaeon]|nr:PspC domain-containing protein [Candidatus Micrarchaeota archaeon]
MAEKVKRLYRSKDRMIAGICGGIAKYLNVDVSLIRILWLIWVLMGGTGLIAYIIAWIIIPEEPSGRVKYDHAGLKRFAKETKKMAAEMESIEEKRTDYGAFFFGLAFVAIGASLIAQQFGYLRDVNLWGLWPVFIIMLGLTMLVNFATRSR